MPPQTGGQQAIVYESITALKELLGSSSEHIVTQQNVLKKV